MTNIPDTPAPHNQSSRPVEDSLKSATQYPPFRTAAELEKAKEDDLKQRQRLESIRQSELRARQASDAARISLLNEDALLHAIRHSSVESIARQQRLGGHVIQPYYPYIPPGTLAYDLAQAYGIPQGPQPRDLIMSSPSSSSWNAINSASQPAANQLRTNTAQPTTTQNTAAVATIQSAPTTAPATADALAQNVSTQGQVASNATQTPAIENSNVPDLSMNDSTVTAQRSDSKMGPAVIDPEHEAERRSIDGHIDLRRTPGSAALLENCLAKSRQQLRSKHPGLTDAVMNTLQKADEFAVKERKGKPPSRGAPKPPAISESSEEGRDLSSSNEDARDTQSATEQPPGMSREEEQRIVATHQEAYKLHHATPKELKSDLDQRREQLKKDHPLLSSATLRHLTLADNVRIAKAKETYRAEQEERLKERANGENDEEKRLVEAHRNIRLTRTDPVQMRRLLTRSRNKMKENKALSAEFIEAVEQEDYRWTATFAAVRDAQERQEQEKRDAEFDAAEERRIRGEVLGQKKTGTSLFMEEVRAPCPSFEPIEASNSKPLSREEREGFWANLIRRGFGYGGSGEFANPLEGDKPQKGKSATHNQKVQVKAEGKEPIQEEQRVAQDDSDEHETNQDDERSNPRPKSEPPDTAVGAESADEHEEVASETQGEKGTHDKAAAAGDGSTTSSAAQKKSRQWRNMAERCTKNCAALITKQPQKHVKIFQPDGGIVHDGNQSGLDVSKLQRESLGRLDICAMPRPDIWTEKAGHIIDVSNVEQRKQANEYFKNHMQEYLDKLRAWHDQPIQGGATQKKSKQKKVKNENAKTDNGQAKTDKGQAKTPRKTPTSRRKQAVAEVQTSQDVQSQGEVGKKATDTETAAKKAASDFNVQDAQVQQLNEQNGNLKHQLQESQAENSQLRGSYTTAHESLIDVGRQLDETLQQLNETRQKLTETRQQLDEAQSRAREWPALNLFRKQNARAYEEFMQHAKTRREESRKAKEDKERKHQEAIERAQAEVERLKAEKEADEQPNEEDEMQFD